ncbi:hypothetical protein [Streptosporangium sp. NPDC000396]|uniref:hypothetical protein n=1 Tax=Streptosporangium sp. NPDC000396 TaxID=3366185 RepID=UPI0036894FBA
MSIADRFTAAFRAEHREVRDLLFSPIDVFREGDTARNRGLVPAMSVAWADTARVRHV